MGQRRKGHNLKGSSIGEAREKDLATIHLINSLLDSVPVDYVQLRKVSAVRGLVNQQVRARVWPVLLGVDAQEFDERAYKIWQGQPHRDSNIVNCDVERSLWSYTEGWTSEERDIERDKLRRVLNAAVSSHDGNVFYYQGLHDITSVLLFMCGERLALVMLRRLVTCHLRDCTRPSLDAVLELLGLLLPILEEVDRPLHAHIEASGVQPFFGLSWYITWFAHNLPQLAQAARLFDLFMASHPLMPLYASAAVLVASRRRILKCEDDPAEMHRLLTNLPPLESLTADELAQQAVSIYRRCPPKLLLQRTHLRDRTSTAAESYLKDETWHVPDKPAVPVGVIGRDALYNLAAYVIPKGRKLRKRAATLASLSIASTLAAVSLGLYIAHHQNSMH